MREQQSDRYRAVRFIGIDHNCSVPKFDEIDIGEQARYRWKCPVCGQRWYVRANWRSSDSERVGRASRRWRRQRAAELLTHSDHSGASGA